MNNNCRKSQLIVRTRSQFCRDSAEAFIFTTLRCSPDKNSSNTSIFSS